MTDIQPIETPKYSADWVREKCENAFWLGNHDCGICGVQVGYVINGDQVAYRSSCGCSWTHDRESSFAEIAEWLAMQSSDEVRDRIMACLKIREPLP